MNTIRILRFPSIGALILTFLTCSAPLLWAAEPQQWVKSRILVQPRAGLPTSEFEKIIERHAGQSVKFIPQLNLHVVELPPGANEVQVARALSGNRHIEFSEVDELLPPDDTAANDPYFDSAWHLTMIGALQAWDISLGTGIVAAILDTGVDANHPDLVGHLVPGWNMYDDNSDTSDVYGHGTKVAGVVAAVANNGIGVTSLAWKT